MPSNSQDLINGSFSSSNPPSNPVKSKLFSVCSFIVICEFCERMAYYGFSGSLVLFFQRQLGYSNSEADTQYTIWSGFCYLTPLLGGWVADSFLGRYRSIIVFSAIYVVGLCLLVLGAIPDAEVTALIFLAIYVVGVGTGGIKPNVSTFGAEQFDMRSEEDKKERESFFNFFYWSINLGAVISFTLIAYICQYGISGLGGEKWGFFIGFLIPTISMALALLIFVGGTKRYTYTPPQGSVIYLCAKICVEAFKRRNERPDLPFLDRAKLENGGSYNESLVEGLKSISLLTSFLLLFVPYWTVYNSMSTTFQNQGCQMDLSIGSSKIPVSALNLFDSFSILALIPVFDRVVYPFFKKKGRPITMLQKIGWGFFLGALSMYVAGLLEVERKKHIPAYLGYDASKDHMSACINSDDYSPYEFQKYYNDPSNVDQPEYCSKRSGCDDMDNGNLAINCIDCDAFPMASTLSVFWQAPQFILIGTSEILASITGLEFFFSQAPLSMKSVSAALNLFTTALGMWVNIPLLILVNKLPKNPWIPSDLNDGKLQNYFYVLGAIMLFANIIFVYVAKKYEYQAHDGEFADDENERSDSNTDSLLHKDPNPERMHKTKKALTSPKMPQFRNSFRSITGGIEATNERVSINSSHV